MIKNDPKNAKSIMSEIDHIQAGIFDINGIMRGKRLPPSDYQKIIDKGIQIPLSAQNIDINGEDNIRKALVGEPVGTLVYSEDDN